MAAILIVDDNQDMRDVLAALIAFEGHEVLVASNPAEALTYLRHGARPDLVLLDYYLEDDVPSTELARWCRQLLGTDTPIVVVSGLDDPPVPDATGFIRKPFPFDRIGEVLAAYLQPAPYAP